MCLYLQVSEQATFRLDKRKNRVYCTTEFTHTFCLFLPVFSQRNGQLVRRTLQATKSKSSNNLERVHATYKNDAFQSLYAKRSEKDQSYLKLNGVDPKKNDEFTPHEEKDVLKTEVAINHGEKIGSQRTSIQHRELLRSGFLQRLLNFSLSILNIFDIFNIIPDPVKPTTSPTVSPKAPPVVTPTVSPNNPPLSPQAPPVSSPRVPPVAAPTKSPISFPINPPIAAPSSNPIYNAPPQPECNPNLSFMIFTGHDMVCSMNISAVNITWSTAFVYDSNSSKFLWCGQYTYDVIIARGEKNFKSLNLTYDELSKWNLGAVKILA